uniref:aldolase/citrate lyase family protein n=1 Tax=Mesorhizobium sp. GbtcB19 TaxID=2824764 RepID=UPI0020C648D6
APGGLPGSSAGPRAPAFGRHRGYPAKGREQQPLAGQIEDETGGANAAAIAAVDAGDVLFVGPGDQCTNMGAMGNPGATHAQGALSS